MAASETCLLAIHGVVYYLESGEWKPQGDGYSLISLYHDPSRDMYRVVGISAKTREAIINSRIFKDQSIKKENDNFFQWSDVKTRYGVNIPDKDKGAEFETKFKEITERLSAQPAAPASPASRTATSVGTAPRPAAVGTLTQKPPPPVSPRTTAPSSTPPAQAPRPAGVARGVTGSPTGPSGSSGTVVTTNSVPAGGRGAPPPTKPFTRPPPPKTPSRTNLNASGNIPVAGEPSTAGETQGTAPTSQPKVFVENAAATRPGVTPPPRLPSFRKTDTSPPEIPPTTPVAVPGSPKAAPSEPESSPRGGTLRGNTSPAVGSPGRTAKPPIATVAPQSRRIPSVTLGHATVSHRLSVNQSLEPPETDERKESPRDGDGVYTDSYFMNLNDKRGTVLKRIDETDAKASPLTAASAQLIRLLMQEYNGLFDKKQDQVPGDIALLLSFLDIYGLGVQDILAYKVLSKHVMAPILKDVRKGTALSPDTDPHLAAEMLKTALAELPRPPINFEKYEPAHSYMELKDARSQVEFLKALLASLAPADKETVGAVIALLNKASQNAASNGMTPDRLAAIIAPYLIDSKWLNYKQAASVKLSKPFQL